MNPTSENANFRRIFFRGFKAILPIMTGVVPFGAVMGTVCADSRLSFFKTVSMNVFVFAGAAQLAAMDLMNKHAATAVVLASALVINSRFLLYSAAMSPIVQRSSPWIKFLTAYCLTDQNYAVMNAHQDSLKSHSESLWFYAGASVCMVATWHLSVVAGFVFGNFAPASWALDYAVPLSFVALTVPTLKNAKYVAVAAFSSVVALLLHPAPYRLGLIITALLSIRVAILITRKKATK